jgi:hypothetical protein
VLADRRIVLVRLDDDRTAVPVPQRGFERLGQPLLEFLAHLQPVDDDLDRVLGGLGELGRRVDLVDLAVDAHARETLGAQLDEELEMLALPVHDHRREDHEARLVVLRAAHRQRRIDHLRNRHRRKLLFRMVRTVRVAHTRVEQAEVIVDLGDGAYRRSRIVRRRLLLDRDRRRQALDQVDIRLLHELQELPRVRRQRFDIATLPLGVQRVEGQRALARSGQARDHDQPMSRQIEIQVLEIVRAGTANADRIHAALALSSSDLLLVCLVGQSCVLPRPQGLKANGRT